MIDVFVRTDNDRFFLFDIFGVTKQRTRENEAIDWSRVLTLDIESCAVFVSHVCRKKK